jgi:hypothetical protein
VDRTAPARDDPGHCGVLASTACHPRSK